MTERYIKSQRLRDDDLDFRIVKPAPAPASEVAPAKSRGSSYASRGELRAPRGYYRLIGVDCFEAPDADFLVGDFADESEAVTEAEKRAGTMKPMYVYSDTGKLIFSAGKP